MLWSLPVLAFFTLPLAGLADHLYGRDFRPGPYHARAVHTRNNTGTVKAYKLKDMYQGQAFLDEWDFFSGPDPTHGNVNYQTKENAISKGLAFVQKDGTTILKVDDFSEVPVGGRRDSVRISTKKTYNGGLFIADFWSMPHGCSVWPAYWSLGPNWPNGGEIDVLEGVNRQETNQYTLHTSAGCSMTDLKEGETFSSLIHDVCESSGLDNRGCGFSDPDTRSYGHEFNVMAGGVYAHLWNTKGITIWRFFRPEIPQDILEKNPKPETWGKPAAFFPSDNCDMAKHFYEHSLVLDTTICGDFAGAAYASSGCPGTCQEALANKKNFRWAKWQLNYIAVYE